MLYSAGIVEGLSAENTVLDYYTDCNSGLLKGKLPCYALKIHYIMENYLRNSMVWPG
jgi:hypothetical protein